MERTLIPMSTTTITRTRTRTRKSRCLLFVFASSTWSADATTTIAALSMRVFSTARSPGMAPTFASSMSTERRRFMSMDLCRMGRQLRKMRHQRRSRWRRPADTWLWLLLRWVRSMLCDLACEKGVLSKRISMMDMSRMDEGWWFIHCY